jgi:hypothetical protein
MACLLVASASVIAGVADISNVETIQYAENEYSIGETSLWDASGTTSLSVDWQFTKQDWDKAFGGPVGARLGVGLVKELCFLVNVLGLPLPLD